MVKRKVVEKDACKDGDDVCGVDVIDRCASARGVQCSVGLYIHLVVLEIEISRNHYVVDAKTYYLVYTNQ